jgi:hypothetical protein
MGDVAVRLVGSAKTDAVETEFDRIYTRLRDRFMIEFGEFMRTGSLPTAAIVAPANFPTFIKELERLPDRIRVEVAGRQYWLIYDDDPRWEEIAA